MKHYIDWTRDFVVTVVAIVILMLCAYGLFAGCSEEKPPSTGALEVQDQLAPSDVLWAWSDSPTLSDADLVVTVENPCDVGQMKYDEGAVYLCSSLGTWTPSPEPLHNAVEIGYEDDGITYVISDAISTPELFMEIDCAESDWHCKPEGFSWNLGSGTLTCAWSEN